MSSDGPYEAASLRALVGELTPTTGTVQELILAVLRRALLEGLIHPGARLRQEDLAALFGTSRIPVREALRALEHEGLLRSEPHRGFTVTSLDADQIEEIYELRIVLESHAVRQAMPLLTDHDLVDLERLHAQMQESESPDDKLEKRERFYLRLYSVTARPRLVGLIARLHQEVARSLRWKLVQHSPSQHDRFIEALRSGDAEAAVAELTQHYRTVAALILRFLRDSEGVTDAAPIGSGAGGVGLARLAKVARRKRAPTSRAMLPTSKADGAGSDEAAAQGPRTGWPDGTR